MKFFEYLVIIRYLFSLRKKGFLRMISFFSFLGITFGVAALIIVMSVMNGFRSNLLDMILGVDGHVVLGREIPTRQKIMTPQDMTHLLEQDKKVSLVVPSVSTQVMLVGNQRTTGALLKGISSDKIEHIKGLGGHLVAGKWQDFSKKNAIVIGNALAKNLDLRVGDTLKALSPFGISTPFGQLPLNRFLTVVGIFKTGMYAYDSSYAYMPLSEAISFATDRHTFTKWEIYLKHPEKIDGFLNSLDSRIKRELVSVQSWKQQRAGFLSALEVEQNVMFLILSLIILVAAFNIISSLVMLVQSKTEEIAILRTMGADSRSILRIFIGVGGLLGVSGTVFGSLLGVFVSLNLERLRQFLNSAFNLDLFSENVYFLSKLPSEVSFSQVFYIILFSIGLSFLATIYPAAKASKVDVREILHRG